MTYDEAIELLYGLQLFGTKLGLDNPRRLAELCGHPERGLRFIHVAGTNGKGSTCAMLESIYRAAGLRVGLFTSPHLVSFTERIQVNRQPIPPDSVARLVEQMQPLLRTFPAGGHPTFFEVVTVLALRYFAEQRCELVIWETGLGGKLDATNIVTPTACVITSIDLDHQQWLGDTLDQIAAEKAGIIKPGIPVITGAAAGRGLEVIQATARRRQAPLTVVQDPEPILAALVSAERARVSFEIPLPGAHQTWNAAVALATVEALAETLPVSLQVQREGLRRVSWPGRFQVVRQPDGRTLVLDGAHNLAGTEALHATWQERFPGIAPCLLIGVLSDKDWTGMAETLVPLARQVLLVPVNSRRGLAPQELVPVCRQANPAVGVRVCGSLREALTCAEEEPWVLVAGSLFLIGEALQLLGLAAPALGVDERALNEWSPMPQGV